MEHVVFTVADADYAFAAHHVREVLRCPVLQFLPEAPAWIAGHMTLRGHSVTVCDLRRRLGFTSPQEGVAARRDDARGQGYVLVVKLEQLVLGFLVDVVSGVVEIGEREMDAAPRLDDRAFLSPLVTGVAHMGKRAILLLDAAYLVRGSEAAGHAEAKT